VTGRLPPRLRSEQGSTTATVIVFPVLITLVMLVLQFALAYHGKAVLTAAAQDAARAAQVGGGDVGAGESEAALVVADNASSLVRDVDIDVVLSPDGREVTATVGGDVVRLLPIPGLRLHIEGSASGPTEEFRPEAAS
jgi:Flp pilus assembly protein TadG